MKAPQKLQKLPGEGPVDAQDVAATVTANYGIYHLTAEQLKALQAWVQEQEKAHQKGGH